MFDDDLIQEATRLLELCRNKQIRLVTAESCTGGLISGLLTEIPGSSDVVDSGFVTYSNTAKAHILGVSKKTLVKHGAVSEPVARAMAEGALEKANASIVVAVTGIAGPGGGSEDKPVGLVHMAGLNESGKFVCEAPQFGDIGRSKVRLATIRQALNIFHQLL